MSDDKNINISIGSKLVDDTMENLLDKPTKSIGETFNDIWFLTLGGPIGNLAEKRKLKYAIDLEKYKNSIEQEIDKIPEHNRKEPELQIVGKTLEESKYCIDIVEMRQMFAKLIAGSFDKEKEGEILPEYVTILSNMNEQMAEDARYLYNYMDYVCNKFPLVDIYEKCHSLFTEWEGQNKLSKKLKHEIEKYEGIFYDIAYRNICDIDKNSLRYFLNRGIISIEDNTSPFIDYDFLDIERRADITGGKKIDWDTVKIKYKYFYITDYGKNFFEVIM